MFTINRMKTYDCRAYRIELFHVVEIRVSNKRIWRYGVTLPTSDDPTLGILLGVATLHIGNLGY